MKIIDISLIFLGFLLGILCFISTSNIFYALIVVCIFTADYFILLRKKFKKYFSLIERVHTSYHFINSFIVTLSVKESFDEAYQNGIRINNARLNAVTAELNEMTVIERVRYLRDYFNLAIYKIFLNVLDLYQDQGGNILNMSDNLMKECTRNEKTLTETLTIGYKHLREFITLWLMAFAILIFMKFSIKDFYVLMLKNPLISPLILVFFLICIASINAFVNAFTNLTVKEDKKE